MAAFIVIGPVFRVPGNRHMVSDAVKRTLDSLRPKRLSNGLYRPEEQVWNLKTKTPDTGACRRAVGINRIHRLYREEGLAVRKRRPPQGNWRQGAYPGGSLGGERT